MRSRTTFELARGYRRQGKSYTEIQALLPEPVAKSTLHYWLRDISLLDEQRQRLIEKEYTGMAKAREIARQLRGEHKRYRVERLRLENQDLPRLMDSGRCGKLALALLIWTEGSKHWDDSVGFANPDPALIRVFLKLFRGFYSLDEQRFRCTVMCRADQEFERLETEWSACTAIPLSRFYRTRSDARTVGKVTKRPGYMGVCYVQYFSATIQKDLLAAVSLLREYAGP